MVWIKITKKTPTISKPGTRPAARFVMVGNSLRSDIAPVLELGGWGIHVPYHTTWAHEAAVELDPEQPRLRRVTEAAALPQALEELAAEAASR